MHSVPGSIPILQVLTALYYYFPLRFRLNNNNTVLVMELRKYLVIETQRKFQVLAYDHYYYLDNPCQVAR